MSLYNSCVIYRNTKITTLLQILELHIGDIIKKYPTQGRPELFLNDEQKNNVEIFTLRTINKEHSILGLVMTEQSRPLFPSPGDIGREFISNSAMIIQNIWWLYR